MKMRFRVVHKAASYLLITTSMSALLWSGHWSGPMIMLMAAAVLTSWFWKPEKSGETLVTIWNATTLLMLGKVAFEIIGGSSVLLNAMDFILFLGINKLFNRIKNQDYQQLYVVSLLQMIAATTVNTDPTFGLLFFVYVIAITWTLILFHLRREMQDNLLLQYGKSLEAEPVAAERMLNSKRLVGGRFLLSTSLLATVVFLIAATFFFLFPRVGFRFFQQSRAGQTIAGFNDTVELGHFGLIKDNPTVVMRVEFPVQESRSRLPFYWRGISFDVYDGVSWSKSQKKTKIRLRKSFDGRSFVPSYKVSNEQETSDNAVVQKIYLDPMAQRVVFGLDRMLSVDLPTQSGLRPLRSERTLQRDRVGDIFYEQLGEVAFQYTVRSTAQVLSEDSAQTTVADSRRYFSQQSKDVSLSATDRNYIQLPNHLSDRVQALSMQLIQPEQTVLEAAQNVESFLKKNLQYTLNLERDETLAPLDDFLFKQRRGHCEYFATAMAVLLRASGVATRLVNGFHGGKWNRFGNYVAVSHGDAHSWVEVATIHKDCKGEVCKQSLVWVRFDPTPAARGRAASAGVFDLLRAYADAFRMRWYKHVIEYDVEQQAGALSRLRDFWNDVRSSEPLMKKVSENERSQLFGLLVGAVLAFIIALLTLSRRMRRPLVNDSKQKETALILELLQDLLAIHELQGVGRRSEETIREYVDRLQPGLTPGPALTMDIIKAHERIRYGNSRPNFEHLKQLKARLAEAKASLESKPKHEHLPQESKTLK